MFLMRPQRIRPSWAVNSGWQSLIHRVREQCGRRFRLALLAAERTLDQHIRVGIYQGCAASRLPAGSEVNGEAHSYLSKNLRDRMLIGSRTSPVPDRFVCTSRRMFLSLTLYRMPVCLGGLSRWFLDCGHPA